MQKQAQRGSESEHICPNCGETLAETVTSRCPNCGAAGLQFEVAPNKFLRDEGFDRQLGIATPYLLLSVAWCVSVEICRVWPLPWPLVLANYLGGGLLISIALLFVTQKRFPTYSNGVRDSLVRVGKFGTIALLLIFGLLKLCDAL